MTPDEQNDLLRAIVDQELPRPPGGFDKTEDEDEWQADRDARFLQLTQEVTQATREVVGPRKVVIESWWDWTNLQWAVRVMHHTQDGYEELDLDWCATKEERDREIESSRRAHGS